MGDDFKPLATKESVVPCGQLERHHEMKSAQPDSGPSGFEIFVYLIGAAVQTCLFISFTIQNKAYWTTQVFIGTLITLGWVASPSLAGAFACYCARKQIGPASVLLVGALIGILAGLEFSWADSYKPKPTGGGAWNPGMELMLVMVAPAIQWICFLVFLSIAGLVWLRGWLFKASTPAGPSSSP